MSAYKQFNTQDIIISPFEVNKNFTFVGGDILTGSEVGINRLTGKEGNFLNSSSIDGLFLTGTISGSQISEVLLYDSIKLLYYTNYVSGSSGFIQNGVTASLVIGANEAGNVLLGPRENNNYYNYPQTTLWQNRYFPTSSNVGVVSIPSKLFGDKIQPNSFFFESSTSGSIIDDGQGRLKYRLKEEHAYQIIPGNIIYEHGIVTLFSGSVIFITGSGYGEAVYGTDVYGGTEFVQTVPFSHFINESNITMSFSSSLTFYETQYKATLNENEFNYSLNPTSITGSQIPTIFSGSELENWVNTSSIGDPFGYITSSYFSPYITTVGLYNEAFELLAVGKLAQPLQSSPTTDTTILVNIDR